MTNHNVWNRRRAPSVVAAAHLPANVPPAQRGLLGPPDLAPPQPSLWSLRIHVTHSSSPDCCLNPKPNFLAHTSSSSTPLPPFLSSSPSPPPPLFIFTLQLPSCPTTIFTPPSYRHPDAHLTATHAIPHSFLPTPMPNLSDKPTKSLSF